MPMTAREAIRRLKHEGWCEINQVGSHKQFKHPSRTEKITVPDHPGDLKPGVERSIKKMAKWE